MAASRILAVFGFLILLIEIPWLIWRFSTAPAESGSPLSVALGSIGLGCMVLLLFYSVARRSRKLRQVARLSTWLNLHIWLALQGVLLVFFHCWPVFFPEGPRDYNFANVGMLSLFGVGLVFFSGLFGRYLHALVPRSLRGETMDRRELDMELAELDKGMPAEIAVLWKDGDWASAARTIKLRKLPRPVIQRALRRIRLGRRKSRVDSAMRIFGRWIIAHRPVATIMFVLAFIHTAASGLKIIHPALVLGGLGIMAVALIWGAVALVKQGKAETRAREAYEKTVSRKAVPPSLHPHIDASKCVGTGACAAVCPEKDVIAVIDGLARVVNPTNCIGHGECKAACPVDAITLVIGSESRGVDIPSIGGDFQTNVPGMYVVGELGGMGLIYNAVTQGVQCVGYLRKDTPGPVAGAHQVAVIGAGPAGLAASLAAKEAGLDVVTLDQEDAGGTILQYPRRKLVMTRPFDLPLYGRVSLSEVRKEALLELWQDVMKTADLQVRSRCRVDAIERGEDGVFELATSQGPVRAQRVILAIGRRGSPRKLGVPGEDKAKVAYRLLEPENYADTRSLVVGGGDSAVEAAIALGAAGAQVTLSYRKAEFGRIKPKNQERLDEAVAAGRVKLVLPSNVVEIGDAHAVLDVAGEQQRIDNDAVFIFAGGVLPTKFLQAAGVDIKTYKGEAFAPANA